MNVAIEERRLGPTEKLFWHNDRAGGFRVVGWVRVADPPARAELERGVHALGLRHPLLRMRIAREGVHALWFRAGAPELPFRVDADSGLEAAVEAEMAAAFPEQGPLARVVWLERDATLLVTVHHSIGDGLTTMLLARDVLRHASAQVERLPLLPAVERWFPPQTQGLRGLAAMTRAMREFGAQGRPQRLPGDAGARRFGYLCRELEAGTLADMRRAARRVGCKIFDLICASSFLAAARDMDASEPVTMTAGCPVNLRERLPTQAGDGAALVIASLPVTLEVTRDSQRDELARVICERRERAMADDHHLALSRMLALQAWMTDWVSLGKGGARRAAAFIEGAGVPTFALSNLGRVPFLAELGEVDVVRAGFAAGLGSTADLTAFVTTVEDRATLGLVYAMPRISAARAEGFADCVLATLAGS